MRFLKTQPANSRTTISPGEKVKLAILGNRLNVTREESARLLSDIHSDVAEILGLPAPAVDIDTEFAGRDLDLTFTVNKQNTPKRVK